MSAIGEGWSLEDLVWQFGAPVSALAVNDNVVFLNILPAERVGERAFVSVSPFSEYYQLENRVLTSPAGSGPRKIGIQRQPGSNRIEAWGSIPLDDPGAGEALAIEEPAEFCARLFRELLEKRGVVLYGRTRARHMVAEPRHRHQPPTRPWAAAWNSACFSITSGPGRASFAAARPGHQRDQQG